MRSLITRILLSVTLLLVLVTAGCYIISGTFVIIEDFEMTVHGDYYFYRVDVTENADWKDHQEDFDNIDAVGLEFVITNNTEQVVNFDVWIDDLTTGAEPTTLSPTASQVMEDFRVPPGQSTITYAQSLAFLRNLPRLKALAEVGKFDYYATSSVTSGSEFVIQKGRVIITLSAS